MSPQPNSRPGWGKIPFNDHYVREIYSRKMHGLLKANFTQSKKREIFTLKLSQAAYEFCMAYKSELNNCQTSSQIKGYNAKDCGRMIRIAACLHIWRHALDDPKSHTINEQDVAYAIVLCRALRAHAEYAFAGETRRLIHDATRILNFICRNGSTDFTVTQVMQNLENMPKDKLLPVLDLLESNFYIKRLAVPNRATMCFASPFIFGLTRI